MSSFTLPLVVTPLADGRRWRLYKPFFYHLGSRNGKVIIKVPKGFVTDFASIPWVFWSWLPKWGKYGKASVVHDRLYHTHQVSRRMADLIFYEAMLASGTQPWKARVMYLAVRIWGGMAWRSEWSK